MQNKFDLVIYGATGFTGRLAVQYMMRSGFGDSINVAIAGRDAQKLQALKESCVIKPAVIIADSTRPETIDAMVKQTKVVLNFAGPFALYGEPVIAACAKWGVDYLDITGETFFISNMIDRYQQQALETGARLIPFSGFDSVPADISVFQALTAASNNGLLLDKLCLYYQIKGGFNGGTLATALNMSKNSNRKNSMVPASFKSQISSTLSLKPHFEPAIARWTAPFFMSPINKEVVRRSAWLRSQLGKGSERFQYHERIVMGERFGYLKAGLTATMLTTFYLLSKNAVGRKLLRRLGPKPGEGPSESVRQNGFFRGRLVCYSQGVCKMIVRMEREGDPGNDITVALACESARLAVENAFTHNLKGFLTPSIAFGEQLIQRLEKTGFRFNTTICTD
jgi:short subunit dehydrogenase-like uncharacterized protein